MPSLLIDIGANVARMQEDMAKTQRAVQSATDKMGSMFKRLAVTAGAALSTRAIASYIKSTVDMADETAKMSQRLGMSVEKLGAYRHMAGLSGVSVEQLAVGVRQLSQNMLMAAQGTGEGAKAFKALGIEVQSAEGLLRSGDEVLGDVADKFAQMPDGAHKTALAMRMFGESGAQIIPLLNRGRDGMEDMRKEAESLGLVMSKDMAQAAERVNDNLTRMGGAARGAAIQLLDSFGPAIEKISDELVLMAKNVGTAFGTADTAKLERMRQELQSIDVVLEDIERRQTVAPLRWMDSFFGNEESLREKREKIVQEIDALQTKLSQPLPGPKMGGLVMPGFDDDEGRKSYEAFLKEVERMHAASQATLGIQEIDQSQRLSEELSKRQSEYADFISEVGALSLEAQESIASPVKNMAVEMEKALANPDKYFGPIREAAISSGDEIRNAVSGWANSFSGTLNDMLWGSEMTFASIAKSFTKMLTEMLIQKLIIMPLLSFAGGGFGGILGALFHEGGVVGKGGTPKLMDASIFADAPRLHNGLASDEYPAILQKGETVIPRDQALAPASKENGGNVNIHLDGISIHAVDAASFTQLAARNPAAITGPIMEALARGGQLRDLIRSTI